MVCQPKSPLRIAATVHACIDLLACQWLIVIGGSRNFEGGCGLPKIVNRFT